MTVKQQQLFYQLRHLNMLGGLVNFTDVQTRLQFPFQEFSFDSPPTGYVNTYVYMHARRNNTYVLT